MKSKANPTSRLAVNGRFLWPTRLKRANSHLLPLFGSPSIENAIAEIVTWLDYAEVGFAELALGTEGDPGAVLRFDWRGMRLAYACDVFASQPLNAYMLRVPLEVLYRLGHGPHQKLTKAFVSSLTDEEGRSLPAVNLASEKAVEESESAISFFADSVIEACVRLAKGERSGTARTAEAPYLATWSVRTGSVRIAVDAASCHPQILSLAKVVLEMEPWLESVSIQHSLTGCRWVVVAKWEDLSSPLAKLWLRKNCSWSEGRPELQSWLREGL